MTMPDGQIIQMQALEIKKLRALLEAAETEINRLQVANDHLLQDNNALRLESNERRAGWLADSAKVARLRKALRSLRELIEGREFLGDWSRAQSAIRRIDEALGV